MRMIYIAGPISGNTIESLENIRAGIEAGKGEIHRGNAVIIPHFDYSLFLTGGPNPTLAQIQRNSMEQMRQYASAFWDDVRIGRVLPFKGSRDEQDEKHVCPLQLDTIERCLELWSAPGDMVLDPFCGIGSTTYCAYMVGRYGIGYELKESYWQQSIKNMRQAEHQRGRQEMTLFGQEW